MEKTATIKKQSSSKGAAIFKQMLEDKSAIHKHLQAGGKATDLKKKFPFAKPLSVTGK